MDNSGVNTVLAHDRRPPARIITQASEHPAVLETCRALQRLHGVQVRYLPVERDGQVDPAALAEALTPDTVSTVCCSRSPNWRPSPILRPFLVPNSVETTPKEGSRR